MENWPHPVKGWQDLNDHKKIVKHSDILNFFRQEIDKKLYDRSMDEKKIDEEDISRIFNVIEEYTIEIDIFKLKVSKELNVKPVFASVVS